ncbi:MAG TPA: thiamine biosynthesis protein ThiS [Acidimicrobiaceae bacterium]|nr:thiamine biosynthesis protein ThiS [Acidimicrobiaceae bacterium]
MPMVQFAKAFRRHVACPHLEVPGSTVREALDAYFAQHPAARSYALDEHGAVRKHVNVFVGDQQVADRVGLTDAVSPHTIIHVFQALSGG